MKNNKNRFKSFIVKMYGSQTGMAEALGVSRNAVNNWVTKNPLSLLKHTEMIMRETDATPDELISEVLRHNDQIN
tara:strand:+ start:395 stop:619 length:225 start_codon:yes stop_codon:yes gene_type:complete